MESEGRALHKQAADAREAGHLTESLHLADEALLAYDGDNDSQGFAEGIGCRSITLRVLAGQVDSRRLLILAMHEMMASVQIARESGDPEALAIPLYNLAKLQEELGEYDQAVTTYKEAVGEMERHAPEAHNRPAVLLDMKVHMSACEYKAGDENARERLEEFLYELEKTDENKFEKDVWVSGGYMKLAGSYRQDNPENAGKFLSKAKEIIDANPELVLRNRQLEKLKSST